MNSDEAAKWGAILLVGVMVLAVFVLVIAPKIMEQKDGQNHQIRVEDKQIKFSTDLWLAFNQLWLFLFIIPIMGGMGLMLWLAD